MPTYINPGNLPEPYVRAVKRQVYRKAGHVSVTGLIQPPQKAYLEDKHDAEIVIDVADECYMLLGSAVHAILERARVDNALQEERLTAEIDGWTISGTPDLLEEPGSVQMEGATLSDYKVTGVGAFGRKREAQYYRCAACGNCYKQSGDCSSCRSALIPVMLFDHDSWVPQVNCYRVLFELAGFRISRLQIVPFLRDWLKRRKGEESYPATPAICVPVPMWPKEQTYRYMQERIALHKKARLLGLFPECTPEERWERPEMWAVKKLGNKTALPNGTFKSKIDAEFFAYNYEQNQPQKYVLKKPGSDRVVPGGRFTDFREADEYKRAHLQAKGVELVMESEPGVKTEIEHRPGVSVRCQDYCKAAPWCQQWARIKAEQEKAAPENKTEAA